MALFNSINKIKIIQVLFAFMILYAMYQSTTQSIVLPNIVYSVPNTTDSIYIALPEGWSIPPSDTSYYQDYILK